MITLLEGTPGAGKSYHAVSDYLLPWVKSGRRLYVYVRGFYLDRLAALLGMDLADLEKQVTLLWPDESRVMDLPQTVEAGAAVFLDEAQTLFRARQRVDPAMLRWLETHRHFGLDILMTCQDYRQMSESVSRLVEVTIKFRRLSRLGISKGYQGFVRGNPEETVPHRTLVGHFDPKVYSYYESYALRTVEETKRTAHVWRSWQVAAGACGILLAGYHFAFGNWFGSMGGAKNDTSQGSMGSPTIRAPVLSAQSLPPPSAPVGGLASVASNGVVSPIRIQGGMAFRDDDGQARYLWVDERGRILTEEDIAVESGGTVIRVKRAGVYVLRGTGVIYGGKFRENETDGNPWADRPGEKPEAK